MIKKILFAAVLFVVITVPCFAKISEASVAFFDEGYVKVSGTDKECANQMFTLKAVSTENLSEVFALVQTDSDESGNFEFVFRIPNMRNGASTNGMYKYYITCLEHGVIEGEFELINYEYLLEEIGLCDAADKLAELLVNADSNDKKALGAMGVDAAKLYALSDTVIRGISTNIIANCNLSSLSGSETSDIINEYTGLAYAASGDVKSALELINPVFEQTEYTVEESKVQESVIAVFGQNMKSDSLVSFNQSYVLSRKIIKFRSLRSSEITAAIEQYDADFDFSSSAKYTLFSSMSLAGQGRVADKMSAYLSDVTTVAQIIAAFDRAVAESESSGGTIGGGSGSGGGGGGIIKDTQNYYQQGDKELFSDEDLFNDLDNVSWAKDAISALANKGVVSGVGDGRFAPNDPVTREQFVKMVINAAGIAAIDEDNAFHDVGNDMWYSKYITAAVKNGIVFGISDDIFGVGQTLTREDMVVLVVRAANAVGRNITPTGDGVLFDDEADISDYAKSAVDLLCRAGVINGMGDGRFAPKQTCTRAEAAKIVYKAFFE